MKIEVKMVEWFNDHWYKMETLEDGKLKTAWCASVTTKLGVIDKPFLARWRGDLGNREADMRVFEAGERGTRIHHAINVMINKGVVIFNPFNHPNYTPEQIAELEKAGGVAIVKYQDEYLQVLKIHEWMKRVNPDVLFAEKTVYDLENKDAGTADLAVHIKKGVYEVNGSKPLAIPEGNYIVDFKTGNQVSDEASYQVAAYAHCAGKMNLGNFMGTIILHTSSKNKGGIKGLSTLLRLGEEMAEDYFTYRQIAKVWEIKNKEAEPETFEFPSMIQL